VPIGPHGLDNGTDMDENPPSSTLPGTQPARAGTDMGFAGTPGDQAIVNAILAGRTGRPADSYGALGPLMYGAVVRGAKA
jgi:phospholipid/cholesterol/gamma-HCH transport system substrate-binding protein